MTIEPHAAVTVAIRPTPGMIKPRTEADYRDDMILRFGKLPSFPELAEMENRAMWFRNAVSPMARANPVNRASPERLEAAARARAELIADVENRVIDAMQGRDWTTVTDLAQIVRMARRTTSHYLNRLLMQGRVQRTMRGAASVWKVV